MFGRNKLKIPKDFKDRLATTGSQHGFDSAQAFGEHLVDRRLEQYGIPEESAKNLRSKLDYLVEEHGYSSREEVVEHLLERGLRAYEEPAESPEELEARLRGLGYIE